MKYLLLNVLIFNLICVNILIANYKISDYMNDESKYINIYDVNDSLKKGNTKSFNSNISLGGLAGYRLYTTEQKNQFTVGAGLDLNLSLNMINEHIFFGTALQYSNYKIDGHELRSYDANLTFYPNYAVNAFNDKCTFYFGPGIYFLTGTDIFMVSSGFLLTFKAHYNFNRNFSAGYNFLINTYEKKKTSDDGLFKGYMLNNLFFVSMKF